MATTTTGTPNGAAPQEPLVKRLRKKVVGLVSRKSVSPQPGVLPPSLEDTLKEELGNKLTQLEDFYNRKFSFDQSLGTIDRYFTEVIPYLPQPEKAVRQYKRYVGEFLHYGWEGPDFSTEGKEVAQLFFERFPVVQSHLPSQYSKRWAEDRLGDLKVYLHNKQAAPKDWDQAKAHEELVNGFTDDKNIKRYHKQHRGRQKLWRGIGITTASALLLSTGLYFHNRQGKVNELEGKVSAQDQTILTLTDANAELDAKNKQWYGDRLKAESERDALKGTVNALNTRYDALDISDVTAVRRAVCDYLATVSGEIVFRYTPDSPALNQLFVAMVGSSSGRDPKEYDTRRARFADQMKPIFPPQDPSGSYYQFFVNDACPK